MGRAASLWIAVLGPAILCLQAWPALGRALHVKLDGTGDAQTVQGGINLSINGDTVWVHPGRYVENIRFNGKNISLISVAGPEATILDGSSRAESVVRLVDGEGKTTLLEGFSITGGRAVSGGGIRMSPSEARIHMNIIRNNEATTGAGSGGGGGLYCGAPFNQGRWEPCIKGNTIMENTADVLGGGILVKGDAVAEIAGNLIIDNRVMQGDGGGIFVWGYLGGGVIRENRIMGNVAADHGGGVVVSSFRDDVPPLAAEISWNVISNNIAEGFEQTGESGGGLVLAWSNAWVHHNTIVGNVGRGGLGDWGGGIYLFFYGSPLVENNIIALSPEGGGILCKREVQPTIRNNLGWNNLGGEGVGDCSNWWTGNGNIVADPQFCDPDAGIYLLAESSPALSHPAGPLGAFTSPGCEGVLVVPTTWGRIKRTFSR